MPSVAHFLVLLVPELGFGRSLFALADFVLVAVTGSAAGLLAFSHEGNFQPQPFVATVIAASRRPVNKLRKLCFMAGLCRFFQRIRHWRTEHISQGLIPSDWDGCSSFPTKRLRDGSALYEVSLPWATAVLHRDPPPSGGRKSVRLLPSTSVAAGNRQRGVS